MYRKYKLVLASGILAISLGIVGCAGSGVRSPNSVEQYDGNEPREHVKRIDLGWLNDVEQDFGTVAARSSSRSLASQDKEVLFKHSDRSFFYQKTSNQFFLQIDGLTYRMAQSTLGDGGNYSFAAEGASENPPSVSIKGATSRGLASERKCTVNIGYFAKGKSVYTQDQVKVNTKSCVHMTQILKDYVP
jgi:hypothetical protein